MERYLEHGAEKLAKDFESMSAILDERRGSMVTLDGVKKRHNILRRFLETNPPVTPEDVEWDEDAEIAALEALLAKTNEEDDRRNSL
jgi:hypothetical protein